MAILTVLPASRAGVEVLLAGVPCAVGGDSFPNTGQEIAIFSNSSGAPIDVTIVSQATIGGLAVADQVVAVPASGQRAIGPFPVGIYNDANSRAQMTYSDVTTLAVAILKVTPAS